jgi:hypothetical protein
MTTPADPTPSSAAYRSGARRCWRSTKAVLKTCSGVSASTPTWSGYSPRAIAGDPVRDVFVVEGTAGDELAEGDSGPEKAVFRPPSPAPATVAS